MNRSYQTDVDDVKAVQEGDSGAWERLVAEYRPNLERIVKQFDGVLSLSEGMEIAESALAEYVLTIGPEEASYLRNKVAWIVSDHLTAFLYPGVSFRWARQLRAASDSMRPKVSSDDPEPKTLEEAAFAFKVDAGTLEGFRSMTGATSLDDLLSQPGGEDDVAEFDAEPVDADATALVSPLPAGAAGSDSRVARLRAAIEQLSPQQQKVIALVMQGMNDTEIRNELGLSRTAVLTHRQRAFARIESLVAL